MQERIRVEEGDNTDKNKDQGGINYDVKGRGYVGEVNIGYTQKYEGGGAGIYPGCGG